MNRRFAALALTTSLVATALFATPVAAAGPSLPLPSSMAAVGDSITQAASTGGVLGADTPANSWSTGTSASVNSHLLRLRALAGPNVAGFNRSVSGAKVADLQGQMANVATLDPDPGYLTVLIGGNDVCTDTVAQMTSVADFRARFDAAMQTITTTSPGTRVYVVSIPDVYQLWNLFKGNFWARFIWATAGICQSLLANPTSTQAADVQRRATVRQRNIDFNTQLAQVCALYATRCHFDGNAAFNTAFTTSDVSGDYFHPSASGQAKLAAVSWAAGYTWQQSNQAPSASFTSSCTDLTCTFDDTSTDADGTILTRSWSFGGSSDPQSHTFAAAGTYPVSLTVTDDDGASATANGSVTVTEPPPPPPPPPPPTAMWVDDLSSNTTPGRNSWTATVTITVSDAAGPVVGVDVSGSWTAGSGTSTCTTSPAGTCQVSVTVNKKTGSTRYDLGGLAKPGWEHQPRPDDPTSITVTKP